MKAYEVIEKPENWTKGALARDADGKSVGLDFARATCFCAVGAIDKAYSDSEALWATRNKLADAVGDEMGNWNDHPSRTHAEVYNLLKSLDI